MENTQPISEIPNPPAPMPATSSETNPASAASAPPTQSGDPSANQTDSGESSGIHRRTGTIARLSKTLRESLNCMLADGLSYADILAKLGEDGKHLNEDNLSRWHAGGYQDWLKEQAWVSEMRAKLDFASDILNQASGSNIHQASLGIAVAQMYGLLVDFNPVSLKQKLADDPVSYVRLLSALAKLTSGNLQYERKKHRL